MFKWLFHILIFATGSGKYQNKEKPLKRQRKLGLLTSKQGSEIISHKFLSLRANIEIMSIACQIN